MKEITEDNYKNMYWIFESLTSRRTYLGHDGIKIKMFYLASYGKTIDEIAKKTENRPKGVKSILNDMIDTPLHPDLLVRDGKDTFKPTEIGKDLRRLINKYNSLMNSEYNSEPEFKQLPGHPGM